MSIKERLAEGPMDRSSVRRMRETKQGDYPDPALVEYSRRTLKESGIDGTNLYAGQYETI